VDEPGQHEINRGRREEEPGATLPSPFAGDATIGNSTRKAALKPPQSKRFATMVCA
jgi:hypothetical protein